jgi:hypothetical protein
MTGKSFKRQSRSKDHVRKVIHPKENDLYEVYEEKTKKRPHFVGQITMVMEDHTFLIKVISSKTLAIGKTICMSYNQSKGLYQIVKENKSQENKSQETTENNIIPWKKPKKLKKYVKKDGWYELIAA